ncbi:MAG: hypothetical protein H6565_17010 [Lewinellaceae bacterium]|nr:hypothetical protein [Lewinellaceae bacterium]
MKKHLLLPAILLGAATILYAQEPVFIPPEGEEFVNPYKRIVVEPGLQDPEPLTPTPEDSLKAGWIHFTMFIDGQFSSRDSVVKNFGSTGLKQASKDRKGKYTKQGNPPHAARETTVSATTTAPNPSVQDIFSLRAFQADSIHPEWRAAALSDTHYFAIVLKNLNPEIPVSGSLQLRYPTDAFDFVHTVFPPNPDVFGKMNSYQDYGDETHVPGTVNEWPVIELPRRDSQTIFVALRVKDRLADSLQTVQISAQLSNISSDDSSQPGDDSQPGPVTDDGSQPDPVIFAVVKSDPEPRVENPYSFLETNRTVVAVNAARDPNSLAVEPQQLPPSEAAPAHTLKYTVHVENLSDVNARALEVILNFDPRIDIDKSVQPTSMNFPNAGPATGGENGFTSSTTWNTAGSSVRLFFNNVHIVRTGSDSSGYYSRASFDIIVKTRAGIELKQGDTIAARATIVMKSSQAAVDDRVITDPAYVHIRRAAKVPFGCVLGIKAHTNLFSSDSLIRTRGIDLTFRFPLVNRHLERLSSSSLRAPRLFWQLEAGWGTSSFGQPADGSEYETKYIHLTPLLLRYYHPIYPGSHFFYTGVSAGYSAGYVYDGKVNGQSATLPSGFGNRLEHELALSIDLSNRIDVPAWTLGVGYKYRWNDLTGQHASYHFPFVYLQLDIVRFHRRFIRVWNKTKYCK